MFILMSWIGLSKRVPAEQLLLSPQSAGSKTVRIFYSETEVGPQTKALYDQLTGIQFGDIAAPTGWIFDVPLK